MLQNLADESGGIELKKLGAERGSIAARHS